MRPNGVCRRETAEPARATPCPAAGKAEAGDGGVIVSPLDKRLRFVVWQDYAGKNGGKSTFGVYDASNRIFYGLPLVLRKNVMLRPLANGSGWQICSQQGTVTYCELRMVEATAADNEQYTRIAASNCRRAY